MLGTAAGGLIMVTNSRTLLLWADAPASAVTPILVALAAAWIAGIVWAVRAERRVRDRGDVVRGAGDRGDDDAVDGTTTTVAGPAADEETDPARA